MGLSIKYFRINSSVDSKIFVPLLLLKVVKGDHLDPLPIPVGLASSTGLPGLSSPSSPLTLAVPATGLFFLKVAGTISAGTPTNRLVVVKKEIVVTELFN